MSLVSSLVLDPALPHLWEPRIRTAREELGDEACLLLLLDPASIEELVPWAVKVAREFHAILFLTQEPPADEEPDDTIDDAIDEEFPAEQQKEPDGQRAPADEEAFLAQAEALEKKKQERRLTHELYQQLMKQKGPNDEASEHEALRLKVEALGLSWERFFQRARKRAETHLALLNEVHRQATQFGPDSPKGW